jgi:hypothetical protein
MNIFQRQFLSVLGLLKWVLVAVLVIMMGLIFIFNIPSAKGALFRGYYTVFYRGTTPLKEIVGALMEQNGIDAVISRETDEILYTDFSGFEKVALNKITERFDQRDPRLDDYINKVGMYFTASDNGVVWDVFFVQTRRNPLYLSLLLDRIAGVVGNEWSIYELDRNEVMIILAIIATLFSVLLMLFSRKSVYHVLLFSGIMPWIFALARGGIFEFILFFFIAYYWALFLKDFIQTVKNEILFSWRDPDRKRLFLHCVLYGGVILFTLFLTSLYKTDLLEITMAIFFQGCLLAVYAGLMWGVRFLKTKKNVRFLWSFQPMEILRVLKPENVQPLRKNIISHGAVIVLCLVPFLLFFQSSVQTSRLPAPQPQPVGKEISISSLQTLDTIDDPSALPDLSDFIRHAAYQERLAAGMRSYDLPRENDVILLSDYMTNEVTKKIEKREKVLTQFDNAWLGRIAGYASDSSIEKMLFNQGECLTVSWSNSVPENYFNRHLWTIIVVWCIVLCPVLLINYTIVPQIIYGIRREFINVMRKKVMRKKR